MEGFKDPSEWFVDADPNGICYKELELIEAAT